MSDPQYSKDQLFFQQLLKIFAWLVQRAYGIKIQTGEIKMNYIVKDDNPDVGFAVTLGNVTDSEGNVIPDAQITLDIQSSDANVLAATVNADGKSGSVHFGAPGIASLTVQAKSASGQVIGSGGDTFTVTLGDPAAIASVSTTFDGLTPAPAPAPTA